MRISDADRAAKQYIMRGCCIHALLADGIRVQELRELRVGDSFVSSDGYVLVTQHKARQIKKRVHISQQSVALILSHIELNDLSDGDYLFPSKYSPKKPMLRQELELACPLWLIEKNLSVWRQRANACRELATKDIACLVAHLISHHSLGMLQHYLSAHQARRSISLLMTNPDKQS